VSGFFNKRAKFVSARRVVSSAILICQPDGRRLRPVVVPAKSVSGRWLLVLSVGAIIIALAFIGVAYIALSPSQGGTLYGTLFVNDGGYSNATASVTASYNATLTASKGNGSVLFTFLSGTDLLKQHLFQVTNYTITVNQVAINIAGHGVVLPWEVNDTVWGGQYDSNYIASWGPSAPAYEVRGNISPSVFGLPSHDYVEFRFEALSGEVSNNCC
jgi:hypothetical protein